MNMPGFQMTAHDLKRRSFTVAEMEQMTAAGVLKEDEGIELIGGEIVQMPPKGLQHEMLKAALLKRWYRAVPDELMLVSETTFRLSPDTYLEPDVVVYTSADGLANLNAATALLVVEIADSSLAHDMGLKARIYAQFGITELWVIDAVRLQTRVHRAPALAGYRSLSDFAATERLVPLLAPDLALTLADLDLR